MGNPNLYPPGHPQADGLPPTPCAALCAAIESPEGTCKGGGIRPTGAAALALLFLTACAPNLGEMPQPQAPAALATTQSFQAPTAEWPQEDWWKAYGAPQLDGLIAEALKDSPSLKIAAARVRSSRAAAGIAEADLWPTLNASGNLLESEGSLNQMGQSYRTMLPSGWHHEAEIAAGLNYQLDFFGKNHAALAAATSAAEAAAADEAEARLQLSTAVAATYVNLVQLSADKRLADEAVQQRKDSAALVRKRFDRQLENQAELSQAEAQVWAAMTQADTIDRLIANVRNQLAALLGKGPDRGLAIALPAANVKLNPAGLPDTLALDLIGRRPDIVAAKKRAEAAASGIMVANANFYPNIDLVGQFGVQTLDAGYLLTASSEFGHFGPAITLPLFDYGRLTGVYAKARADYDAAVAVYDMTLTDALRDVANAYTNRRSVETELAHARAALASAEASYRVSKARYAHGLARYIDVLTAETQLIGQRRTVADYEAGAFASDVALVRALGGGYAATTDKQ
jgi:NodT family efflux transporter outer membrane factor (OMF) lipoprotein